jgi:hypothetical protein
MTKEFLDKLNKIDLSQRFIKSERFTRAFVSALSLGEHAMFYGRGGHGKSEMAMEAFAQVGIDPFVLSFHENTTIEELFGGIDPEEWKKTGKIKYLFENSMFNHQYVIAEEAFDAPGIVWASIKDALTSGHVRFGNDTFEIKTKSILFLTNRSKEEVVEDNSVEAFMQRIVFNLKVEWDSYTPEDYSDLLECVFKDRNEQFATIISDMSAVSEEDFISPRTCVKAYKAYITLGIDCLQEFEGFSVDKVERMKDRLVKLEQIKTQRERLNAFGATLHEIRKGSIKFSQEATMKIRLLKEFQSKLKALKISDSLFPEKSEMMRDVDALRKKLVELSINLPKS